ncbi:MAG: fibronectin type III domain-containing protein, partial [Actinobacteria bacterium]|nr:fibronectin type III domain-containing protein [Actinomycetota bacterium]
MMVIALTAALAAVVPTAVHADPVAPVIGTSDDFTVIAAAPKAAVTTATRYNETHLSNGSEWYFTARAAYDWGSFGFAPGGMTIDQRDADTSGVFDDNKTGFGQRLSWHVSEGWFQYGWRAGSHVWLNDSTTAWRAIYTSDEPTYYPSGPQNNVAQSTITDGGWTLCFAQPYDSTAVIREVFDACGGAYLLVGGIAGHEGPDATAPDAPTAVTATAGDGQATVSWTAPANNGGADIDTYQVEAVGAEAGCQAQAPATTCIVTGLPNLQKFTFTVTAHNSVGTSVASGASTAVWTHSGDFQVFVEKSTIALGDSTVVHVWGATPGKPVTLRVG